MMTELKFMERQRAVLKEKYALETEASKREEILSEIVALSILMDLEYPKKERCKMCKQLLPR